jgi:superfamily II DNA or RNA helicase
MRIKQISRVARTMESVYNLEVQSNNNYYANGILVSNCHKIRKGNKITDLIKVIKTPCKFGFTGTMPESLLDQWNIIGKIGYILYERDSNTLRKDKYIADVCCQIIELSHKNLPEPVEDKMKAYRNELEFIINSPFRNNLIAKLAANVTKNCLILIDFIRHGNILEEILKKNCPAKQVFFIQGSVEVDEREKVKQLMETNADVVVIAISKIFSTGINIKNLHYIVFAGGGKAKLRVVQSIGRGLRLHATKTKLILLDIADNLKYGNRHANKRQKLYGEESIPYTVKEIQET